MTIPNDRLEEIVNSGEDPYLHTLEEERISMAAELLHLRTRVKIMEFAVKELRSFAGVDK